MLPDKLRVSVLFAQLLGAATLLRSIAYERWITVVAALLLLAGTLAAQRGRTWGVALSFAVAVWFPVAALLGMAPAWFIGVGLAAATPFFQMWRSFTRFDRGAAALFATLATSAGVGVAVLWNQLAHSIFMTFPSLAPSRVFQNGLLVLATLAGMTVFAVARSRRERREERARSAATPSPASLAMPSLRIATAPVVHPNERAHEVMEPSELDVDPELAEGRRLRRG